MPEVEDGDGSSGFATALPVQPDWADSLARITLTGPDRSVTLYGKSDRPVAFLRDPGSGQVRAVLRDLPGSARTQADIEEAFPPQAGLELRFSRGIPDAGAWRR